MNCSSYITTWRPKGDGSGRTGTHNQPRWHLCHKVKHASLGKSISTNKKTTKHTRVDGWIGQNFELPILFFRSTSRRYPRCLHQKTPKVLRVTSTTITHHQRYRLPYRGRLTDLPNGSQNTTQQNTTGNLKAEREGVPSAMLLRMVPDTRISSIHIGTKRRPSLQISSQIVLFYRNDMTRTLHPGFSRKTHVKKIKVVRCRHGICNWWDTCTSVRVYRVSHHRAVDTIQRRQRREALWRSTSSHGRTMTTQQERQTGPSYELTHCSRLAATACV